MKKTLTLGLLLSQLVVGQPSIVQAQELSSREKNYLIQTIQNTESTEMMFSSRMDMVAMVTGAKLEGISQTNDARRIRCKGYDYLDKIKSNFKPETQNYIQQQMNNCSPRAEETRKKFQDMIKRYN